MADQEVALQVRSPLPVAFNPDSALTAATNYQTGQSNLMQAAQNLQAGQTQLQMLNRENTARDIQFNNQQIANAAAHGMTSEAWDANFQDLVNRGVPGAEQFLHRYNPILQQRVLESYGAPAQSKLAVGGVPGGSGGAGGQGDAATDMLNRIYQNTTPQQRVDSLQKNQTMVSILPTIHDQQSLDQAIRQIDAVVGKPIAASILGQQFSPLATPININKAFNDTQGRIAYLQNRVSGEGTGVPAPLVKKDMTVVSGVGYDPYTGKAITPNIYKVAPESFDAQGRPILYSEQGGELKIPGAVSLGDAATRIMGTENATGNPAAKNPLSSATGNGQFIDKTWLDTFKQAYPDAAKTLNDQQILALRADPQVSAEMTKAYGAQNAGSLSAAGMPVTTASLTLAHRFGPEGAIKILNAPPNTPMEELFSSKVIEANPQLRGQTAGQYAQKLIRQVGNDSVNVPGLSTSFGGSSSTLTGDDYLKSLPSTQANQIRALAEGRLAFPAGFALKSPYWQRMLAQVAQYDPSFDAVQYNARARARTDATSGKLAANNNALNTGIGHIGQLADSVADLGNVSWSQDVNAAKNWLNARFGGTAVTNFDAIKNRVAPEIVKIWRGTGGAESDIKRDIDSLSDAKTPAQLYGAIHQIAGLMQSKIEANEQQYSQAMGAHGLPIQMITPKAQGILNKIEKLRNGEVPEQPTAEDIKYARNNPSARDKFIKTFGVEP